MNTPGRWLPLPAASVLMVSVIAQRSWVVQDLRNTAVQIF